jgi:prolyl oligopeptidase
MKHDAQNTTLLWGYGGFELTYRPSYSACRGKAWLEKGGVFVLAGIRGGGEYGPRWHQAALKEKRFRCFEDMEAVAGDLIARGVTRRGKLGVQGGSNGGLLMGNLLLRPSRKLWSAVVCQVPQVTRGRIVDGGVRKPGHGRLVLHAELLAVPGECTT